MNLENNLDIGDYMDIVTTYKCRFCTFTSSLPQGISNHVRQVHVPQQMVGQDSQQTQSSTNQTADIGEKQTTSIATSATQINNGGGVIYSDNVMNGKVQVVSEIADLTPVISSYVDMAAEMATSQNIQTSAMTIIPLESVGSSADKILELSKGIDNNSETDDGDSSDKNNQDGSELVHVVTAHDNNPLTAEFPNNSADIVMQEDDEFIDNVVSSTQEGDICRNLLSSVSGSVSLQPTNGVTTNSEMQTVEVEVHVPAANQQMVQTNAPHITKELFLCGQCSVGFNSIDECRTHMIQDHNTGEDDFAPDVSGKVSVGTQYEGKKKAGRKKKSQQEKPAEVLPDSLDSDSDWEREEYHPRASRSRRKIRPPKALKEDYYLGKRKKKDRPKPLKDYKEKCPQVGCYAKFKTKESLQIHMECHVDSEYFFRCIKCQEEFPQWKLLRYHLWKKHQVDTDLLTCDVCEAFKTDTLSKMLVHKEIHSDERPYTCDVCGRGFKQFSQMRNHQMIHTEHQAENQQKFTRSKECEICHRHYANQKCLNKHIQAVHNKIKPFICPHCGHTAARKAMMELHIRVHTGEKPFKCDVCPYTTGDHNSLRRHKMRHTGQKPYRCEFCGYSCIQAISIKMHMKNKHPGGTNNGVYCCDICVFRTVNEASFKNHMEDHKNGLIVESSRQSQMQLPQQIMIGTPVADGTIKVQEVVQGQTDIEGQITGHDIIEIQTSDGPKSPAADVQNQENNQLQMQIQTLESGETQISEEDLTKLTSYEGLVPSDISAAQLVLSALNAISENSKNPGGETPQILNGIQTSITSSSIKEGVTTHTITFHLPVSQAQDSSMVESVGAISDADGVITPATIEGTQQLQVYSGQSVPLDSVIMNCEPQQAATIQDLAQVSCLLKNSVYSSNGMETMVIETMPQAQPMSE